MREFENFIRTFIFIEFFCFLTGLITSLVLKGFSSFTSSYLIGYTVMAFDYYLLVKFSRQLPQQVFAGYFPKPGFFWRYLSLLLILVGLSLFTRLDFFAIISAVALSQLGLFVSVVVYRKEWRKWKEA